MTQDPRKLLAKYGLAAKKSWGQNFLVDPGVYDAIVRAAVRTGDEWIVEIGAGLGTLTDRLGLAAERGHVVAIEREREMVQVLRAELGARSEIEVVEANALAFDYQAAHARAGKPLVVVGNLPYQIATPLIFHMLAARQHLARIVIMLQKEMADRIVAKPDTRAYGALGVMVTTYAEVRLVIRARAGAFVPAPRVDSAVVELAPLVGARFPLRDEGRYSQVVHAAFGQRRKTLRNALRQCGTQEEVDQAMDAAGIDGKRRGETLSLEEFARLANQFADA